MAKANGAAPDKAGKERKKRFAGKGSRFFRRLGRFSMVSGTALAFLAGCAGNNRQTYDPLIGGAPAGAPSGPQAAASLQAPVTPLPPQPAPGSPPSNAALAVGTPRPLDPSRDLRIGNPPSANNDNPWHGSNAVAPPPPPRPDLGAGITPTGAAITPAGRSDAVAAHSGGLPGSPRIASYEQAQASLKARGVSWQRLDSGGLNGSWRFSCSIPNPSNRAVSRTYEAEAADQLGAMQAVLDKISKDQG